MSARTKSRQAFRRAIKALVLAEDWMRRGCPAVARSCGRDAQRELAVAEAWRSVVRAAVAS